MYHQIFTSVKIASPMPARAGNFARTFRRTFRRRLWQQGPTRNGGGSSSPWETHSGLCRFSGTGFRKNHFFDYRRDTNAGRRPPLAVSCRGRHRLWDAGDCVSISRRKKISPRTDLDDRPRLGGKTPPSPGRRVPVDSPEDRRFSNRSKSHRRCRHAMEPSHGRSDGRSDAGYGKKKILLEPTSTTGRGSAARPRPRPGDACRSIAPKTDVSQIGRNRIAVVGTPSKLRTDVPTDVPTPAMAAGSDSVRRGMLLRDFAKIG